jgi:hypothetical protein
VRSSTGLWQAGAVARSRCDRAALPSRDRSKPLTINSADTTSDPRDGGDALIVHHRVRGDRACKRVIARAKRSSARGTPSRSRPFVGVVRGLVGASLIGTYVHGSAVLGGMQPGSDLDLLAVIDRPTTDVERRRLLGDLMHPRDRRDDQEGRRVSVGSRSVGSPCAGRSAARTRAIPGQ